MTNHVFRTFSVSAEKLARRLRMERHSGRLDNAMEPKSCSAQAAGYSRWLAPDESALDHTATRIAPKFGV